MPRGGSVDISAIFMRQAFHHVDKEVSGVAQIVFENACKSGLVLTQNTSLEFAKQVQQNIRRKRKGSMDAVAHDISQVVQSAANALPKVSIHERLRTTARTVDVPKLDIPLPREEGRRQRILTNIAAQGARAQSSAPAHVLPSVFDHESTETRHLNTPRNVNVPTAHSEPDSKAPFQAEHPIVAAEARPAFGLERAPMTTPQANIVEVSPSHIESPPSPVQPLRFDSWQSKIGQGLHEPSVATVLPTPSDSVVTSRVTVEDWAEERQEQLNAEKVRVFTEAAERNAKAQEDALQQKYADWVRSRTVCTPTRPLGALFQLNEKLYQAEEWRDVTACFREIEVAAAQIHQPVPLAALEILSFKARLAPSNEMQACLKTLTAHASQHSLSKNKFAHLRIQIAWNERKFEEVVQLFGQLSQQEQALLPRRTMVTVLRASAIASKDWKEAWRLVKELRGKRHDPFCMLEACILSSARRRTTDNVSAINEIEAHIRGTMNEVGKYHATRLIACYGASRQHEKASELFARFSDKHEADESLYSSLVAHAPARDVDKRLSQARADSIDPACKSLQRAHLFALIRGRRFDTAWSLLEQMKGCGNVLWPCLSTQILLSRLAIGVGSRAAAAEVVQCTQACKRVSGAVRNIMYPLLAKLEMYSEIRTMESFVVAPAPPLDDLAAAAIATAKRLLDPDSAATPPPRDSSRPAELGKAPLLAPVPAAASDIALPSLEKMLECARDHNWKDAVSAIKSVPSPIPPSQMGSMCLAYNCALSAAIDEIGVAEELMASMKHHHVTPNATTYNTLLAAYSRTNMWERAIEVFRGMPADVKDTSSFHVIFALLAKKDMWELSLSVFDEMKRKYPKPPVMAFNMVIQAVYKHDWNATLALFKQLHANHGKAQVKEIVLGRVLRALEAAGRTAEVAEVKALMSQTH